MDMSNLPYIFLLGVLVFCCFRAAADSKDRKQKSVYSIMGLVAILIPLIALI